MVNKVLARLFILLLKIKWYFNKWCVMGAYHVEIDEEGSGNIAGQEVTAFKLVPVELPVSHFKGFGMETRLEGSNLLMKCSGAFLYDFIDDYIVVNMSRAYVWDGKVYYDVQQYQETVKELKANTKRLMEDYCRRKGKFLDKIKKEIQ